MRKFAPRPHTAEHPDNRSMSRSAGILRIYSGSLITRRSQERTGWASRNIFQPNTYR